MKVILFDRDGVLIQDPPDKRVDTLDKLHIFPESIEALRLLSEMDYRFFIMTNQAGINEGLLSEEDFSQINDRMYEMLEPSGIEFERLYFSPCTPEENCDSRKPNTGMFQQLVNDYGEIDVENSFMIGDRDSDIEFGQNIGVNTILMSRTDGLSYAHDNASTPDFIAPDLLGVVGIVEKNGI